MMVLRTNLTEIDESLRKVFKKIKSITEHFNSIDSVASIK